MLHVLLADAELELVPESIASHPSVVVNARKRGKKTTRVLLDTNLHHAAMKDLEMGERRGRPDIVHFFLLLALDSILNQMGELRVYVHTRNNELILVDPLTRLPKNYPRFVGLMETLFNNGVVPSKEMPLLRLMPDYTFEKCLNSIPHDRTVVLSPTGKPVLPDRYFKEVRAENLLCVIGGFPEGDFLSNVYPLADEVISISDQTLTVWTVLSELLVNYENAIRR
ncbi:MAG: 16S rRNA methyltransferase [Thermoplasmata archaeon]|nr:16S rRNA methyltransferase [Thermoplasmata archaeon]